jgi:uncharacterized protein (TIGR02001 family)
MRKSIKHLVLGSAAATTALFGLAAPAAAEVSGNVAVVSQYYFRGLQFTDNAAVQGGIDYTNSGFYIGGWASTLSGGNPSYELDAYAGYGQEYEHFTWDVGALAYLYPDYEPPAGGDDLNYAELYFNGGIPFGSNSFNFGLAYTFWSETDKDSGDPFVSGDLWSYLGVDFAVSENWGLGATLGYYDFKNDDDPAPLSYAYLGLSAARGLGDFGEVSFNLNMTDIDEDNGLGSSNSDKPKIWIGWSKDF